MVMTDVCRYAKAERCVADIYFPPKCKVNEGKDRRDFSVTQALLEQDYAPVAIFIHGGIWAIGESD